MDKSDVFSFELYKITVASDGILAKLVTLIRCIWKIPFLMTGILSLITFYMSFCMKFDDISTKMKTKLMGVCT